MFQDKVKLRKNISFIGGLASSATRKKNKTLSKNDFRYKGEMGLWVGEMREMWKMREMKKMGKMGVKVREIMGEVGSRGCWLWLSDIDFR